MKFCEDPLVGNDMPWLQYGILLALISALYCPGDCAEPKMYKNYTTLRDCLVMNFRRYCTQSSQSTSQNMFTKFVPTSEYRGVPTDLGPRCGKTDPWDLDAMGNPGTASLFQSVQLYYIPTTIPVHIQATVGIKIQLSNASMTIQFCMPHSTECQML